MVFIVGMSIFNVDGVRTVKLDEIVKKVLGYIFPEVTNKITLMVVFSGVTLLSSSLIEQILKK